MKKSQREVLKFKYSNPNDVDTFDYQNSTQFGFRI